MKKALFLFLLFVGSLAFGQTTTTQSTGGSVADALTATEIKSFGGIDGGKVDYVSASTLTIGTTGETSYIKSYNRNYVMTFTGTLPVDITTSGVGGLSTGVEASSTWYAVHLIGDSTGVNTPKGILDVSFSNPTLPSG